MARRPRARSRGASSAWRTSWTRRRPRCKSRAAADLREFNNRKSQGLLELSRSLRYFQGAPPSNAVLARLAGLREKLDINQAVLKLHLEAVREVSTIMADAIRDAEFGRHLFALGPRRAEQL